MTVPAMPYRVAENAEGFSLELALPGVDPAPFEMLVTGSLTASAPTLAARDVLSKYARRLPATVETAETTAESTHGVLRLTLPQHLAPQPGATSMTSTMPALVSPADVPLGC
jgi:HSP20 family molecular chaperone IbpA